MLSIVSDYMSDRGSPEAYLRRIAEAGFSHVHWGHHWGDDFLYSGSEIREIGKWLADCGLELDGVHASSGREKLWGSVREYERLAGVELVRNRIEMASELSCSVIVMHLPREIANADEDAAAWRQLHRSLEELEPCARERGVRIAVENGVFSAVERVLGSYPPDYVGLCYDAGHGNMSGDGLDRLDVLKDRLIAAHLHDNDGTEDQHIPPFTGTVDWERLAPIIAKSSYAGPVSLELLTWLWVRPIDDEEAFLQKAFETGSVLSEMIDKHRQPDADR